MAHVTREGQAKNSVGPLVRGAVQMTQDGSDPSNFRHGFQGHCETCHHSARQKGRKHRGACVRGLYEQSLKVSTSLAPSLHYLELTPDFRGARESIQTMGQGRRGNTGFCEQLLPLWLCSREYYVF